MYTNLYPLSIVQYTHVEKDILCDAFGMLLLRVNISYLGSPEEGLVTAQLYCALLVDVGRSQV